MTATSAHSELRSDCAPELAGYWLRHCHGFQVIGPEGRIGFVEMVDDDGESVDLVIAAGLFHRSTWIAHEPDIRELDIDHRRVVVSEGGR